MENNTDYKDIKGWGVDADPANEPTFPMRKRTELDHEGYHWPRSRQQKANVEILHSNERPNLSAVFGTSSPPSGLSGVIRRFAFRYSEGSFAHWIPLILADRVNVWEGIIDDLSRGYIPNIIAERGWKAEWKYNRKSVLQKAAIGAAVAGVLGILLYSKTKTSGKKYK